MMVFFWKRLGKILIWQKFSETWESDFNLRILYPPPYQCEIWHYDKASTDLIRRSIHEFSWENRFSNTDANQKVYLFNATIKNILSNFIHCDGSIAKKNWSQRKILLRSAIYKVTVIFNYFEGFRAFKIS